MSEKRSRDSNIGVACKLNMNGLHQAQMVREPYSHCRIDSICLDASFLESVVNELQDNIPFEHKQTDLYSLFQSPDLQHLDKLSEKDLHGSLDGLMSLRDALYSEEFRQAISAKFKTPPLTGHVDLAASVYTHGSHLLMHDDAVGTRAVAYVVYLPDHFGKWSDEYGGALELYNAEDCWTPAVTLLPDFNTMSLFAVQSGVSVHSVEEVRVESPKRLSIQGWYHTAEPIDNKSEPPAAPITVLKEVTSTISLEVASEKLIAAGVNPRYFSTEVTQELQAMFNEMGVIRLAHFISNEALLQEIADQLDKSDSLDGVGLLADTSVVTMKTSHSWEHVSSPSQCRFQRLCEILSETDNGIHDLFGRTLDTLRKGIMTSNAFATWLTSITETRSSQAEQSDPVTNHRVLHRASNLSVRRFRPGFDYTLSEETQPSNSNLIEVMLTFCNNIDGEVSNHDEELTDDLWESCEIGGFDCYSSSDSNIKRGLPPIDPTLPLGTEESEPLILPCQNNCLNVISRCSDQFHYTKYLQSVAPSSRIEMRQLFN